MNYSKSLVLTCILTALSACGGKSFEEHVSQANQLIEQGNNEAALIELKNAVQQKTDDANVRVLLANTYIDLGFVELAEKEYKTALKLGHPLEDIVIPLTKALHIQQKNEEIVEMKLDSRSVNSDIETAFLSRQALAYIRLNDVQKAKEKLNIAQEINSESEYTKLLYSHLEAPKNIDVAYATVNEILAVNPDFTDALMLKGKLATYREDYQAAIDAYNKHLELLPHTHYVRLFLADVYVKNGQMQEAESNVDLILKRFKQNPFANQLKALIRFEDKDYESAQIHIERAIQYGANTDANKLIAGLSTFQLSKYEQAHNYLSAIEKKLSNSHPAKKALAFVQIKLGYILEDADTITNLEGLSKSDAELLTTASYELMKVGKIDEAKTIIQKADGLTGKGAKSLTDVGILKLSLEDLTGVVDLEQALEVDPNLPVAKAALAAAYIATENYSQALELAQEWKKQGDISGYNLAANIYHLQNNTALANKELQEALKVEPGNKASYIYFASEAYNNGNTKEALDHLKTLLKHHTNDLVVIDAAYQLGKTLGNTEFALNKMKQLHNAKPDSLNVTIQLAKFYFQEQQNDKVVTLLNAKKQDVNDGTSGMYWFLLAKGYMSQNQMEQADKVLNNWILTKPQDRNAYLHKLALDEELNNFESAIRITNSALTQFEDDKQFRMIQTSLLIKELKPRLAQKNLDEHFANYKDNIAVKKLQSEIYFLEKRFNDALRGFNETYSKSPTNDAAKYIYLSHLGLGQVNQAYEFLQKHVNQVELDVNAMMLLADRYLQSQPKKA